MDIAVANTAIEIAIIKYRRFFRVDFCHQMPVRLKRWRIWQQDASEFIQFTQRITGKLQPQINAPHVHRIVDGPGEGHPRVPGAEIRLHRKRRRVASKRQHAANFAGAGQGLPFVAPFGLQAENIIPGFGIIALRFCTGHFAKRQRFAQRIDQDLDISFADLVVDGDPPAIEENIVETE